MLQTFASLTKGIGIVIKLADWAKGASKDNVKDTIFATLGSGTALISQDYNKRMYVSPLEFHHSARYSLL
jgi:hypothetical protein